MTEPLGKLFSLFGIAILVIIVPFVLIGLRMEQTYQNYTNTVTQEFVSSVKGKGEVDPDAYLEYITKLANLGTYKVTMECKELTSYPDPEAVSGYRMDTLTYSNEEILDAMYEGAENEPFVMNNGDTFIVEVNGYAIGSIKRITDHFLHSSSAGQIISRHCVTVEHYGNN